MRNKLLGSVAAAALVSLTAACGSNVAATGGGSVQVDVGAGKALAVAKGPLRVGFFTSGTTNEWLQVLNTTAQAKAKEFGWKEVKIYDPAWDPAKQLDQIQNAIQKKEIDAAIVLPVDGKLLCQATTKQLPAAGILTVVITVPVCGHEKDDGPGSYVPGLLSYVGSIDNVPYNKAWIQAAAGLKPGAQQVAMIQGPAIGGQAIAIDAALDAFKAENPTSQFDVKYKVQTDYTTGDGLAKTQALLKAHPDVTVIMSVYSPDLTRGVIQAVHEAGKSNQIAIIDVGGTKWAYEQMAKGDIQMTMPNRPIDTIGHAMDAFKEAQEGKKVPTFLDDQPASAPNTNPMVITRQNMAQYQPQF